jgi:hypothetical protein
MFSFGSKPLGNLLGAAYLTGALEGIKKSKSLDLEDSEKFFQESKHIRRILLSAAESDGYNKPVEQIEEAKKSAKKILNSQTSTNSKSESPKASMNVKEETVPTTPSNSTPSNSTPSTLTPSNSTPSNSTPSNSTPSSSTPSTLTSSITLNPDEIMPLKNSTTTNVKKPNTPPPVLQLGGNRRRKTKKQKRRSK